MRELRIADVTSILINTKIQKYKKHANILPNIFPGKKKQKTRILFLKNWAVFHRIFLALLKRLETKIKLQKNMPALRLKYFQKKKHKKKNSAVNHEIFLQALLERQDGERRRWREETEMRTLDMEHQVWIVIMMMNIIFILIKWWSLYFWENQCTKKQYSFEFSSSLKLRKERWSWQSWKQNGQGISCLFFYF